MSKAALALARLQSLVSPTVDEIRRGLNEFSARDQIAAVAKNGGGEGVGQPIAELDDGVNSIYVLGSLAAAPAGGLLVLAVDDGTNPSVHVALLADVIDNIDEAAAAAAFATAGVTVIATTWAGGPPLLNGNLAFEFTGDYGHMPTTLSTVSNTIVDGNGDPIALNPADPTEAQAGVANTPGIPPDPTTGDHYLDTRAGLTWTYTADGWSGGLTVDYVESDADVPFTEAGDVVIESNPLTFDGSTAITFEFFTYGVSVDVVGGACRYSVSLNEGATQIHSLVDGDFAPGGANGNLPIYVRSPTFTPNEGEHTFSVKAFGVAGGGGTIHGSDTPIYLRVNRA